MFGVQQLRVSVHKRLNAAAEDFLLRAGKEVKKARVRTLRALLTEVLTAAAEELFTLFAETIAECEVRIERSEQEICRQTRLLDAVLKPDVRLHRLDTRQVMVYKEESPVEQQLWIPVEDQEDSEDFQVKLEQSELPVNQEGELHQGLEEADGTTVTFSLVALKSNKEQPHPPGLHRRQCKENRVDRERPEPAQNSSAHGLTGPVEIVDVSPEPEIEDSEDDLRAIRGHQSCLNKRSNKIALRASTAEKPFSCSKCGRSFARKANLNRHLLIHRGYKSYRCSECNKVFSQKYCLNLHMRTHRPEQTFSCLECGKVFVHKHYLKKHMRTHRGEKPYKCSECGKGFIFKSYLTTHMLCHRGDKPFSCSQCGKRFATVSYRNQHLLVHKGESQFSCSVCNKGFICKRYLDTHMKTHRVEKPFSCPECDKRFAVQSYLNKHILGHRGGNPFSCSFCGKRFIRKYSLSRHMSIHFGEKPFSCSECGKRFTQKSHLNKHLLGHK